MKDTKAYSRWIEAAYLCFAEEGPKNLSITTLAKKCGLPRTNFYYYFENKEDLIHKVIEFHFKSVRLQKILDKQHVILIDGFDHSLMIKNS